MGIIPATNLDEGQKKKILDKLLGKKAADEPSSPSEFGIQSLDDRFIIRGLPDPWKDVKKKYTLHINKELLCQGNRYDRMEWLVRNTPDNTGRDWKPLNIFDYVALARGISQNPENKNTKELKKTLLNHLESNQIMTNTALFFTEAGCNHVSYACIGPKKLQPPLKSDSGGDSFIKHPDLCKPLFGIKDYDTVKNAFEEAFGLILGCNLIPNRDSSRYYFPLSVYSDSENFIITELDEREKLSTIGCFAGYLEDL